MAGQVRPGTEGLALLEETWQPMLRRQTNEAGRIFPTFDRPEGVSKIGNKLHISKILRQPVNTLGANDTGVATYANNTELDVTVSPVLTYGAVQIQKGMESRMLRFPALQKAYREQMIAGLVAEKDSRAGAFAASLSVARGGIGQNIDLPFLLDGIGTLGANVRGLWEPGTGKWAFLHIWPQQYKQIMALDKLTSANIRGDGQQVIRVGWTSEALGLAVNLSGNVYSSGGIAHNFLHIKESHVYGLNEDFQFLTPQEFDLTTKLICFGECGFQELWDEYGVDMQTTAA